MIKRVAPAALFFAFGSQAEFEGSFYPYPIISIKL